MTSDVDDTRAAILHGSDLDYVIAHINTWTPGLDPEDDPGTLTGGDMAVYRSMLNLRAAILVRQAVQAGSRQVGYCGVDDGAFRACGADLGLPDCDFHARHSPTS